ncbi:GatB/YqeY domain-containing protein [Patescibacteria group bacterium]|nr:GatB/YqeY domain-containing protein [Patescibacteria group bacterium]MBU2632945.1 GatB/YqeY domain-containing protein [Patescibacteria group bacterium]
MDLKEKIQKDMITALKSKEEIKSSTLRMLLAAINNGEIGARKKDEGLSKEEIQKIIKSETKKRRDSIEAYEKANRTDLAEKEKKELSFLKEYLPEEISDKEIEKITGEAIADTGAHSMQDFGSVMKEIVKRTGGQADGKKVSEIVKKLLN